MVHIFTTTGEQFILFMFRKQVKYAFIIKNENDSFVNLLFFAELVS